MKANKSRIAFALVLLTLTYIMAGCSNPDNTTASSSTSPDITAQLSASTTTDVPATDTSETPVIETDESANSEQPATFAPYQLTETQRNSINMLNHLVVFTQEVNGSKNSRLFLEEAYSSLYNNTNPNAVDERTQVEINYLFDRIEEYRMTAVKRNRLEFIYEQNQAQALRDAVPNPLALMSTVRSFNLAGLITSVVYMAVDSMTSYQSSSAQSDLQYLKDGWELDDEQARTLHNMRKGTFNYMVDTVRQFQLPGTLALNEKTVANFVEWKGYTNNQQKIQLFEDNVTTYEAFGPYWLTLAECYYANQDYQKCLDAVERYESLGSRVFRNDYEYAKTLPLAIAAAEHQLTGADYEAAVTHYAKAIDNNTENEEWALRYFTAQTYIDLYSKTNNADYLAEAYRLARSNVSYLLTRQLELNAAYLAEVKETETPKDATGQQKQEITQYNKLMKEERKTALPPVYEPLYLNYDLLFALTDELTMDDEETSHVNGILHENGDALFLSKPIDLLFWFTETESIDITQVESRFTGSEIVLPAAYLTDGTAITATVVHGEETVVLDDWKLNRVERANADDLWSFMAHYTSEKAKAHKFVAESQIVIEVIPKKGSDAQSMTFMYKTIPTKKLVFLDAIDFQRVEI